MEFVKCRNLAYDKRLDDFYCKSTRVCFKSVCFRDIFMCVKYYSGATHVTFYNYGHK